MKKFFLYVLLLSAVSLSAMETGGIVGGDGPSGDICTGGSGDTSGTGTGGGWD